MEIYRPREMSQHNVVEELYQRTIHFLEQRGIVVMEDEMCRFMGQSLGGGIILNEQLDPVTKFMVLIHETTHELIHPTADGKLIDRSPRAQETHAEAVACGVLYDFGINTIPVSSQYVQTFGDFRVLRRDRELIWQTRDYIVGKIKG